MASFHEKGWHVGYTCWPNVFLVPLPRSKDFGVVCLDSNGTDMGMMCFLRHECLGRNNKWSPSKACSQLFLFHMPAILSWSSFCWIKFICIQHEKLGNWKAIFERSHNFLFGQKFPGVVWLAETAISKQHDVRLRWPWRGLAGPKISMQKDGTNKVYRCQVTTSQWRKPPNTIPHPSVLSLWNTRNAWPCRHWGWVYQPLCFPGFASTRKACQS